MPVSFLLAGNFIAGKIMQKSTPESVCTKFAASKSKKAVKTGDEPAKKVDKAGRKCYNKRVDRLPAMGAAFSGALFHGRGHGQQFLLRRRFSVDELKNAASKAVGTKAVMRALKAGSVRCVYVARDIDTFLYQKVTRACEEADVPLRRVDETKALGAACGLEIPCAAAAILK